MVTTEVSQLTGECNAWREDLRNYRHEFTELNEKLPEIAGKQSNKDILLEIEHLHNQFHIQLINIHDLRHKIKFHTNTIAADKAEHNGRMSESLLQNHEHLFEEFQSLKLTLDDLKNKFQEFLKFTDA